MREIIDELTSLACEVSGDHCMHQSSASMGTVWGGMNYLHYCCKCQGKFWKAVEYASSPVVNGGCAWGEPEPHFTTVVYWARSPQ